MLIYIADSR